MSTHTDYGFAAGTYGGMYMDTAASAPPMEVDPNIGNRTAQLLDYSYNLAQSILVVQENPSSQAEKLGGKSKTSYFRKVSYIPFMCNYVPTYVNLFGRGDTYVTNVTNNYYGSQAEKKDNNAGVRFLVGIVAAIALGTLAYLSGKTWVAGEDLMESSRAFQPMKHFWDNNDKKFYDFTQQTYIQGVIGHVDAILERRKTRTIQDIALLVLGMVAAGCALAGALTGSSTAMAVGVGFGVVLGAAAIAKYTYQHFSKQEQRNAEAILAWCRQLNYVPAPKEQ